MRKQLLGFLIAAALVLPLAAGAQPSENPNFSASELYVAKFLCGESPGGESRIGVVEGHYNTVINVQALKNRTRVAFRATAISSNFEIEHGVPSDFSFSELLDLGFGARIVCNDIKNVLDLDGQGFVEGFVSVYSNKPLVVETVLTGEGDNGVSVMQVLRALRWATSIAVRPPVLQ
jgi:hypothetical protein